ncbi:MAG: L-threonylcarbamoyladenylate synthase [Gammaproteobacteria bacterium]|nr:L-threonylcarbamoyladenylate synthase [Gammaproteobacteria bacterium]
MTQETSLNQAVEILRVGGLVAIPTETVYGLGADARNENALKKIFAAKGRPADHPLIVHIGDISQLKDWARDIPETVYLLAKHFWPGPLTLILKKNPDVSDFVTGQQDSIGLRIPSHPIALALLKKFGSGIAAPSANRFGHISPTTAEAVREELGEAVDLILEGGQCERGLESTILNLSADAPVILRPGMISRASLEKILKQEIVMTQNNAPRVSGSLESHYAPRTPTKLFSEDVRSLDENIAILSYSGKPFSKGVVVKLSSDPEKYAHDLYQTLRELDHQHFSTLWIERVPETSEWDAVRDRLVRASS